MGEVLFPHVVQKILTPLLIDPILANNTWMDIIRACHQNKVPDSWKVGDQKIMVINGIEYPVDIIGKNHDVYADGSSLAPLTFQLHDCYVIKYGMNATNTNVGSWADSAMRNTHFLEIFAGLPSEVRAGIRKVSKQTSAGNGLSDIVTTADSLFLLSEFEVFGAITRAEAEEGAQYAFYKAGGSKQKTANGVITNWRLRSPAKDHSKSFCGVGPVGESNFYTTIDLHGVAPAFCF